MLLWLFIVRSNKRYATVKAKKQEMCQRLPRWKDLYVYVRICVCVQNSAGTMVFCNVASKSLQNPVKNYFQPALLETSPICILSLSFISVTFALFTLVL